jgi:hypothetical protein
MLGRQACFVQGLAARRARLEQRGKPKRFLGKIKNQETFPRRLSYLCPNA